MNPGESKLESKWSIEASKKAAQARKRKRKLSKAKGDDAEQDKAGSKDTDS